MQGVYDDFFLALYGTCHAADALVIVDDRMVVDDFHSTLRTCTNAVTTADTTESADFSNLIVVLISVRARDEVSRVSWNHTNQALYTAVFSCAGAAAVALFCIDDYITVSHLHGVKFTSLCAVTAADAAIAALTS